MTKKAVICSFFYLVLFVAFLRFGVLNVACGDFAEKVKNNDILSVVYPPSGIFAESEIINAEDLDKVNGMYTFLEQKLNIIRKENPLFLSADEFNKIPDKSLNIARPEGILGFYSVFFNTKSFTLESQKGIFASQAFEFKDSESADKNEKCSRDIPLKHWRFVYRKGNIVGIANQYLPGPLLEDFLKYREYLQSLGFTVWWEPPKLN